MTTPLELVGVDMFGQVRVNAQRRGEADQETRKEADEFVRCLRQGLEVRGSSSELEGKAAKFLAKKPEGRVRGTEASVSERERERKCTESDDPVPARQRPKTADPARSVKVGFSNFERRPFSSRDNAANSRDGTTRSTTKAELPEHSADHGIATSTSRKPHLAQNRSVHRGLAVGTGIAGVARPSGVSRRYETVHSRTESTGAEEGSRERMLGTLSTAPETKNMASEHLTWGDSHCKERDLAPPKASPQKQSAETDRSLLQEEEELRQLEAKLERDRTALKEKKMRVKLERMAEELRLEGEKALLEFEDALQSEVEENIFAMMKDKERKVAECRRLQAELLQHVAQLQAAHADLASKADEYEQSYVASVERVKELHAGAIAAKRHAIEAGVAEQLEAETRKNMEVA